VCTMVGLVLGVVISLFIGPAQDLETRPTNVCCLLDPKYRLFEKQITLHLNIYTPYNEKEKKNCYILGLYTTMLT